MISKNQIKQVKALHLKKFRDEEGLFIAEGVKIVSEIIHFRPEMIECLFATEQFLQDNKASLGQVKNLVTITDSELERISTLQTPNQVLSVCKKFPVQNPAIDMNKQFTLYLDDIRDPGNLGTILRIADWFGIHEIFVSEKSTDLYNPKTIQAAMGAFLRVRVHYLSLDKVLNHSKVPVYGAVLNGENIYKQKLQNGLIIIGNEANGITEENLQKVSHPITIPASSMNETESLNAAMATSIICSEFFRQIKL